MARLRVALRVSAAVLGAALVAPVLAMSVPASAVMRGPSSPTALSAAVAVGRKAAILVQLGVFTPANSRGLPPTVEALTVKGASHASLLQALERADAAGQHSLDALRGGGARPFPPVTQALSKLSAADFARASAGSPISVSGDTFMGALDSLLLNDGKPLTGPPADPPTLQSALDAAIGQTAGVNPQPASATDQGPGTAQPPAAAPSTDAASAHSSHTGVLLGTLAALAVALGAFFAVRTRRRKTPAIAARSASPSMTRPAATGPPAWAPTDHGVRGSLPPAMPPATAETLQMAQLLDISRRLASITAVDEIHRVIVREAMGLVDATSAALIVRDGDRLVIAHEGRPGLLVEERLTDGAVGRVAETGQPALQVSATEPALRQLPAAMLAVPLVAGGAVAAVLVMVRAATSPFAADDRDLLMALTPVAAAAMHGAAQTTAAMHQSLQDALTGVGNRLRFDRDLTAVLAATPDCPVTLVMLDIDHFKNVNDTYGHPAGDALLRGLGEVLRSAVRPGDGVYRYGGEEFALLLPGTTAADAADLAERVRAAVESRSFDAGGAVRLTATASLGVATTHSGDATALVALADAALYEAKHNGRNRVCTSQPAAAR